MHPKEVVVKFHESAVDLATSVLAVAEPWDSSKEIFSNNLILSHATVQSDISMENSKTHTFCLDDRQQMMCRFLVISIVGGPRKNSLMMISIKRWIRQYQQTRLQKLQGLCND